MLLLMLMLLVPCLLGFTPVAALTGVVLACVRVHVRRVHFLLRFLHVFLSTLILVDAGTHL